MSSDRATEAQALLEAFQLSNADELQDLFASLILSECVYKSVDQGHAAALRAISSFLDQFPRGTVHLASAQFCRSRVSHRYMLASGGGALYVAFMGTKELRDVLADVSFGPRALWENLSSNKAQANNNFSTPPGAHGGFLSRAEGIPAESLLLHALKQKLRLVFCGHSLGGAVATLVMLRLLSNLSNGDAVPGPDSVRCITFGVPAFGTPALGEYVDAQGWGQYFASYALPEDPVPRLSLSTSPSRRGAMPSSGGGGSGGGKQSEAALESVLYEEEAQNSDSSSSLEGENGGEEEEPGSIVRREGGESFPRKVLTGWKEALQSAARTAGTLRLPMPTFLSYSHFGAPLYLTVEGTKLRRTVQVVAAASEGVINDNLPVPPRGLLSTHRMPAYRSRVLHICYRALPTGGVPPVAERSISNNDLLDASANNIAPPLVVSQCTALLPILWKRTPVRSSNTNATAPSVAAFLFPRLARRSAVEAPVDEGLNFSVVLKVAIQGSGLDTCTAAAVTLPGSSGQAVFGQMVGGNASALASQLLQAELIGHSSDREEKEQSKGPLGQIRSFLGTKMFRAATVERVEPQKQSLDFEFTVPAGELLLLDETSPSLSLTLFSDFNKVRSELQCIPMNAWIVSLDDELGRSAFAQLESAAKTDVDIAGRKVSAAPSRSNVETDEKEQQEMTLAKGSLAERGRQFASTLAQQFREKLSQQITDAALHSVRYRGLRIHDASPAVQGVGMGVEQRLMLLAELLKWHRSSFFNTTSKDIDSSFIDDFDVLDEDDEDFRGIHKLEDELSLRQRLRLQLHRAVVGSALWRRRKWHFLAQSPPPQLIIVLLNGEMLRSKGSGGSEFDVKVLDAVHAVAATAAAGHCTTLLAVASPEARDAAYRRRLSFSSGLQGRPGAVVPIDVGEEDVPTIDARLLQAAALAHAAAIFDKSHRSISADQSVFRARL